MLESTTHRRPARRAFAAVGIALAAALTLGACSGAGDSGNSASKDNTRTITHAMGTTKISGKPQRVVTLDQSYVEAALALETPVVGFTEYRGIGSKLPEHLGDAREKFAGDAISVGTLAEPDLEKIAELKPDLIVSAKVRHEKIYDQLSKIAPTVMSESTGPSWKENILLLGQALDKEGLAKKKIGDYETKAKRVGAAVNNKANNPTVAIVRFSDGPTRIYHNASFSGIILRDAGLRRPANQDVDDFMAEISEEKIPEANADKIFVSTYMSDKDSTSRTKETFERNPLWAPLKEKVVEVNDATWMTAVSLQGADLVLDDIAKAFGV